jgi:hypothetical protein
MSAAAQAPIIIAPTTEGIYVRVHLFSPSRSGPYGVLYLLLLRPAKKASLISVKGGGASMGYQA